MSKESLLKKEFRERDVNRARNLIKKDYSAKTAIGTGYTKKREVHAEGDVWEEDGRTWTIKNGIRQNITKLDKAKKAAQVPLACPKCGGPMNHHLHKKMYKIHGFCFDCTVDYEAKLRRAGLYESYEKAMIQGSLKAWATDLQGYVNDFLDTSTTYVTEQGDVEDWKNNTAHQKETILKNLEEYLDHVQKALNS